LRQALTDVEAISALTPPCSECFKVEYLTMLHEADPYVRGVGITGSRVDESHERIHRLMNLLYVNWLAQADQPRANRLPAQFDSPELYAIREGERSDSKLRDPADVNRWFALPRRGSPLLLDILRGQVYVLTSSFFVLMLPSSSALRDAIDREAVYRGVLILDLALQTYQREHGHFPADLQQLVKDGYLKELPAEPFAKAQPLRYRRQTDPKEQAIVWSVWYDGIDQEGREAEGNGLSSPGDKVYRLGAPKERGAVR
jgi:competence protein ComGC